jgi:hypothetical protein
MECTLGSAAQPCGGGHADRNVQDCMSGIQGPCAELRLLLLCRDPDPKL